MKERLVDVLNVRNTVLHVFPIAVEDQEGKSRPVNPEREAVELASRMHLVPDEEVVGLHARPHVTRGGQLTPYGDALETKMQCQERAERCIRERAYFLWQQDGCPENRADEYWHRARTVEEGERSAA